MPLIGSAPFINGVATPPVGRNPTESALSPPLNTTDAVLVPRTPCHYIANTGTGRIAYRLGRSSGRIDLEFPVNEKANHFWLSGDQKGAMPSSVPASGCAERASRRRTQI